MGQAIVIASGKVERENHNCCLYFYCFKQNGKKVLAIDFDFGLRNLDLALLIDDKVVFDIADVISYGCSFEKAVIAHPRYKNLCF
jgi:septum site-determining protein MinD